VSFWVFAAAITFSAFAAVAIVLSTIAGLGAARLARWLQAYTPDSRAMLLFRLRMLPAIAALLVAFGVALPIFSWFEPRQTNETLARTLIAGAVVGLALLTRGTWRGARALAATERVHREWLRRGRRLDMPQIPLPIYAVDEPFPVVAVIGLSRPALFVAERVLRECPSEEVMAMVRHECAHAGTHDNLKRLLMLVTPALRVAPLDRAWTQASEEAADAAVVAERPELALDLAQALIRVARLAPAPQAPVLASAFYRGGSIEARVRRLAGDRSSPDVERVARPIGGLMAASMLCVFAVAVVLVAPALHQMMESFVSLLP
jgi:beta-lactamase regulating signal transducer with metallopeptidase domain